MERCPIAAKVAGSIGILPCCVLNDFFTKGYELLPDCEASLSHHTLYMEHFGHRVYWPELYHAFSCWKTKKITKKNKRVTAPILKPTDDQKPETFLLALTSCSHSPGLNLMALLIVKADFTGTGQQGIMCSRVPRIVNDSPFSSWRKNLHYIPVSWKWWLSAKSSV